MKFYVLQAPGLDDRHLEYGNPKWEAEFGRAEWSESTHSSLPVVNCPINAGHRRAGERQGRLVLILPSSHIGDFVWTWQGECIVTRDTESLLEARSFGGYRLEPVEVEAISETSSKPLSSPLSELKIVGKGGPPDSRSGVRLLQYCQGCGLTRYSSFRNGLIVNEETWDGSDFLTLDGFPRYILVTQRVRDTIAELGLTNCVLIPSDEIEWPLGVERPETLPRL